MILTKTPYRISLIGGGSDYPEWYLKYSGETISSAIDKYIYISCRELKPYFSHSIRLVYSKVEEVASVEQIKHPSAREVIKYHNLDNIEIHYDGDLPARSGMGSSSAFTVGLHFTLNKLLKKTITKKNLAMQSIMIEQDLVKENVGSQDQVIASYGGFKNIKFCQNGKIIVKNLNIEEKTKSKLEKNLFLIFSGINREAHKVASTFINKLSDKKEIIQNNQILLDELKKVLISGKKIDEVGRIIHESWTLKKKLSKAISNNLIDEIYLEAIKSGSTGGKILGAGAGGFLLFYVPKDSHEKFLQSMKKFIIVPFNFESRGSRVIYSVNNSNK